MEFFQPTSLAEALEIKSEHPRAVPLAGGTDLMVEINFGRRRPEAILDVTRVVELDEWSRSNGMITVGSGVSYTRLVAELTGDLPALSIASRTVGSPQIRNRGTVGGNLGTASPAGDALPPLLACDASVQVASTHGARSLPIADFFLGPKRNALEPGELIVSFTAPRARGPQQFSKIGTRNAMVIAVASFALALDLDRRRVGTGIGSAGPRPLRAPEAERFLEDVLEEGGLWGSHAPLGEKLVRRFGELVASSASPIDDVRGTARYRRHALSVMARRALAWAWNEKPREGS